MLLNSQTNDFYFRQRPYLGTFVKLSFKSESSLTECDITLLDHICNKAFTEIEKLQKIFSIFDPNSELSKINQAQLFSKIKCSIEFYEVLKKSLELQVETQSAFDIFSDKLNSFDLNSISPKNLFDFYFEQDSYFVKKNTPLEIDLNGISKSYIIDQIFNFLTRELNKTSLHITVNIGGDLRQTLLPIHNFQLRLGTIKNILLRNLQSGYSCLATSSLDLSLNDKHSNTRYFKSLRKEISSSSTVSSLSHNALTADALCKLALFGKTDKIEKICLKYDSQILVFDESANLIETFGYEIHP